MRRCTDAEGCHVRGWHYAGVFAVPYNVRVQFGFLSATCSTVRSEFSSSSRPNRCMCVRLHSERASLAWSLPLRLQSFLALS